MCVCVTHRGQQRGSEEWGWGRDDALSPGGWLLVTIRPPSLFTPIKSNVI